MRRVKRILFLAVMIFVVGACQKGTATVDPNAPYNELIKPDQGQPAFPKLGQYWVVDPTNACRFGKDTIVMADQVLEKLRQEDIAEVAVVCQKGVKSSGPLNDEKIWAMKWGRWAKLGDKQDRRAIVWLIRPDVKPQDNRVTIEVSLWLTWYTAIDYGPGLEEAAEYVNANNFDGALESIVRTTNETLRIRWKEFKTVKGESVR